MKAVELRGRALHEAGHAVMSRFLGLAVGAVWLDHESGRGGAEVEAFDGTPRSARKHALVSFAGTLAQRRVDPDAAKRLDAVTDHSHASDLLEQIEPSETARERLDAELWDQVQQYLANPTIWRCIEALADEVLLRRRIEAPAVSAFIDARLPHGGR